jgi:hypothetical protein
MKDSLELAQNILENVIMKHFKFYGYTTEQSEDGTINQLYSEKSDEILNDLIKEIEKHEQ